MKPLKRQTAQRLSGIREKKKVEAKKSGKDWRAWTQASVAERLGVELSTYQKWEIGEHWPDPNSEVFQKLALEFGVSPGYFFDPAPTNDLAPAAHRSPLTLRSPEVSYGREDMVQFAKAVALEALASAKMTGTAEVTTANTQKALRDPNLSVVEEFWPKVPWVVQAAVLYLLTGQIQYAKVVKEHDQSLEKEAKHIRAFLLNRKSARVKKQAP